MKNNVMSTITSYIVSGKVEAVPEVLHTYVFLFSFTFEST